MNREKVDFFVPQCRIDNIVKEIFGLCDSIDLEKKTPAYVDYDNVETWIAHVRNLSDSPITFIAVDNCIRMLRVDGKMDNRCDAILTNGNSIAFVELKCQRKDWIEHAVDYQLQTTIDYFCQNNDITKYKTRRAFVCNKRHPRFTPSYKERMTAFFRKNKIRLNIQSDILFE